MRINFFWVLLFTTAAIFLISAHPTNAQKRGEIFSLQISPDPVVVLESMTISIGVQNPLDIPANYVVKVLVLADGEIKREIIIPIDLESGEGIFISPTHTPTGIGRRDILVKLYDQTQTEVLDQKLLSVNVISELGPFDIDVDVPSKSILPGERVPVILSIANFGEKATDVQVRMEIPCQQQPTITDEFFIFLFPGAIQDKTISMPTCKELGPHEVFASIILFNKTWISASTQFFLNESFIELLFNLPETISIKPGEQKIFDLEVQNRGNIVIRNLKMIIPKIPSEWVTVTPKNIIETEPREKVIFIINITVPSDANPSKFPVGFSAAADETLTRKETLFEVLPAVGVATAPAAQPSAGIKLPSFKLPSIPLSAFGRLLLTNIYYVLAAGGASVAIFVARKLHLRVPKVPKPEVRIELQKVKEAIKEKPAEAEREAALEKIRANIKKRPVAVEH